MSEEKNLLEEAIGLLRMVYMAVSGCDETEPHRAYDQLRLDVLPSIVEWEERARSVFFKEESKAPQSTRPAPELPEGYREDEEGNLWFGKFCLAVVDKRGRLMTSVLEHEFPVLAIWLQRRSK